MKRKTKVVKKVKRPIYGPLQERPIAYKRLKCVWNTRLIIPAEQTPSKTRYEFMPGETKPVRAEDYDFLLSKVKQGTGCCGGSGTDIKYFEEV